MQRIKVLKFGGSSVGNTAAFIRTADILLGARNSGEVIGVISAIYGVTNRLLDISTHAASRNSSLVSRLRHHLVDTHVTTARSLCTTQTSLKGGQFADEAASYILDSATRFVDKTCREIAARGMVYPSDVDAILSVGERWSAKLLSSYLLTRGEDAPFIESDRIIVTTGRSGTARPDLAKTSARVTTELKPLLERGAVPIVTGFFGQCGDEPNAAKVTTLGRGGSDLSATVLASVLNAAQVTLYKVEYTLQPDGWMACWKPGLVGIVHDADPAHTISSLSYEEAHELSQFGKKVLHPEAVLPAALRNIPICVRNTLDTAHLGTRIEPYTQCSTPSSAFTRKLSRGVLSRIQTVASVPLIDFDALHGGNCANHVFISLGALGVCRREDVALVAIVGQHAMQLADLPKAVVGLLTRAGVRCYVPTRVNGSEHHFSIAVPASHKRAAVDVLHSAFVLSNSWQTEGIS